MKLASSDMGGRENSNHNFSRVCSIFSNSSMLAGSPFPHLRFSSYKTSGFSPSFITYFGVYGSV